MILTLTPLLLGSIIGIVFLIFCRKYINPTISFAVIIGTVLTGILVKINWKI